MGVLGNPVRLVVYGGIGSGKSSVTALLSDLGFFIIEADKLGHLVLEPGGGAHAAVAERWPEVVADGVIDRSKLAAIVFTDAASLRELEAMSHPHIRSAIGEVVADLPGQNLALEMPILRDFVGEGWVRLLVDAPLQMRIDRAVARGIERQDAEARAASQPDDAQYHEAADWVIANTGSLADLESAVHELWRELSAA